MVLPRGGLLPRGDASLRDPGTYGHATTDWDSPCHARDKGCTALSGYRTPLYDSLGADRYRVDANEKLCNSLKGRCAESLWMRFERPANFAHGPSLLPIPSEYA